jgi:hypothetical protein
VITTGSKYFFGLATAAFVAAFFYAIASNGGEIGMNALLGALTLGYKGGTGDQFGYAVLMSLAATALFLGIVTSAFRDADAEAQAGLLELEAPPAAPVPQGTNYWPIIAAFGAGTVAIGVVVGSQMVIFGVGILIACTFEWATRAWSERVSADPAVNRTVRNRLMYPIEIPVLAVTAIAVFVLSISRILIAIPKGGAYALFGLVPAVILLVGWFLSARPKLNRNVVAGLLLLGGIAVLAGGIVGASVGPRHIEKHHEEGSLGVPHR